MFGALFIAFWTAAGTVAGTLLGYWAWRLLATGEPRSVTIQLAGSILTAALFGILAWRLDNMLDLVVYSTVAAAGVPLAIIDSIEHRLPSTLLYPALGMVGALLVASAILIPSGPALMRAMAGMAALTLFYLALALGSNGGLGAGDVKLGALLGLVLGWASWSALLMGTLLGWSLAALASVMCHLVQSTPRDTFLPLGPYLLFGAIAVIGIMPPRCT